MVFVSIEFSGHVVVLVFVSIISFRFNFLDASFDGRVVLVLSKNSSDCSIWRAQPGAPCPVSHVTERASFRESAHNIQVNLVSRPQQPSSPRVTAAHQNFVRRAAATLLEHLTAHEKYPAQTSPKNTTPRTFFPKGDAEQKQDESLEKMRQRMCVRKKPLPSKLEAHLDSQ